MPFKVSYTYGNSSFLAEGTQAFVSSEVDRFFNFIKDKGNKIEIVGKSPAQINVENYTNDFENIYTIDNEKVKILKTLPGNDRDKTISIALIILYAKSQLKIEEVEVSEIRDACKAEGCNPSNFAKYLKSEKRVLNQNGKLKLTKPGIIAAHELLETLNN